MNLAIRRRNLVPAICLTPAFALALAGCMRSSDFRPPTLAAPVAAEQVRRAMVARSPALTEEALPSAWWQLFGDAALTNLEAEASASNLDLQAAAARVDESRAQLGLANASRQPQVAADASYMRAGISQHSPMAVVGAPTSASNTWALGLEASWELDLWGHLRHLSESADANLQASAFGMASVKVSVAGDVARTYLLLRGTQTQITITEENRQIAEHLVQLADSRLQNGVATRFDVASSRADVASIEARLSQLHQQRDALMNALALLLGRPPRELDAQLSSASLPSMPQHLPIGVPSELAHDRPDILQAEARLRAAVADIGAAKADFYPRISLTGNLGVQAFDRTDLGSWSSRQFAFGPILYLPIFQGGRLERNLELSEARHRLAGIAYQQTVLKAWHEVDDALNAYSTELKRHEQLQEALTQNQTALDVAQRGYQQGTADFTSVLVARRSLLASQGELVDCATASALSVVSLYRALGGGWSPELLGASTVERSRS
ncbi:efflux transporter outer membrane subunit [Dyella soli]|uniref:Efflux transporter outer membrane subunit n=2 Tax=Dyella soli TaxID=522319 RepID=A0A4R0YXI0_9GAMM|nr:efflux transporter outer membrane subunit [Dyella soli]